MKQKGFVYAAIFSDGVIKVGKGRDALKRIKQHEAVSAHRKATLVKSFISSLRIDAAEEEKKIIMWCCLRGQCFFGREWFTGIEQSEIEKYFQTHLISQESLDVHAGDHKNTLNKGEGWSEYFREEQEIDESKCAWRIAEVLESVMKGDMWHGEIFKPMPDHSAFKIASFVAVHGKPADFVADLMCAAAVDQEECIFRVFEACHLSGGPNFVKVFGITIPDNVRSYANECI